ncbi:unnamed protein product [Rhizoctonia solani]|uniref:Serine-threonine/tyrosine-protein kinase catalytic domain-containing protein n=1 Tax=Rhizoctonia solani TaxID=456999 RepID=A0A8H3APN0_9AGAM|nr:unnamed protein product [Rhizoctonia solani]
MMHVVVKKATPVRPRKVIPERSIYGNILWAVLTSCWSYDPDLRPNAQTILDALRPLTPDKLEELEEKVAERDESDDD